MLCEYLWGNQMIGFGVFQWFIVSLLMRHVLMRVINLFLFFQTSPPLTSCNDRPLQTTIFALSHWWPFYTSMTVVKHTTSPRYQFQAVPARFGSNSLSFAIAEFVSLRPPSGKHSKYQRANVRICPIDTDINFNIFINQYDVLL